MGSGTNARTIRELEELVEIRSRRLHLLRRRAATYGIDARPEDLMEIEDIEKEIAEFERQLERLRRAKSEITGPEQHRGYLTLNLRFSSREPSDYEVLLQSDVGDAVGGFSLPLTDKDLHDLRLDVSRAGTTRETRRRERSSQVLGRLTELGQQLYEALPAVIKERYQSARDKASAEGYGGVRLRLTFADPCLILVPWECLYEPGRREFLGLSIQTPIVRYAELPYPPPTSLEFRPPLRILAVLSNPCDLTPLDGKRERQRIASALRELEANGQVSVRWLEAAESGEPTSLEKLHDALFAFRPQVLHFVGHGDFDSQRSEGHLYFEGTGGENDPVSSWRLAQLAASTGSLRLVFLNACRGAKTAEIDQLSGVAMALVQKGIPAVIGMQFEITDGAAIEFASKFYQRLAQGAPVDTAVQEARIHLRVVKHNLLEWATPVLYLWPRDGQVFRVKRPDLGPGGGEDGE